MSHRLSQEQTCWGAPGQPQPSGTFLGMGTGRAQQGPGQGCRELETSTAAEGTDGSGEAEVGPWVVGRVRGTSQDQLDLWVPPGSQQQLPFQQGAPDRAGLRRALKHSYLKAAGHLWATSEDRAKAGTANWKRTRHDRLRVE